MYSTMDLHTFFHGVSGGGRRFKRFPSKNDNFYENDDFNMGKLKELCRAAGLSSTGTKAVLVNRLTQSPITL